MVFYKLEFILGMIILAFGITFLIMFLQSEVIFTIGTLIPFIFIITGIYLIYEAFTLVEIEELKVKK